MMVDIGKANEKDRINLQYNLSIYSVPKILQSILTAIIYIEAPKDIETKTIFAIVTLCKDNIIGQVLITEGSGIDHFKGLFENRALSTLIMVEEIFKDHFNLFYVHRSLCNNFFEYFSQIQKGVESYLLSESDDKTIPYKPVKEWFDEFCNLTLNEEGDT